MKWLLVLALSVSAACADELAEARAALRDHLPAVAELKARAVLEKSPDLAEAHRVLATALAASGRNEEALAELDRLPEFTGRDHILRARLLDDEAAALAAYRAAYQDEEPEIARAAALGEAGTLGRQGQNEAAEAIWRRLLPDPEASLLLVRSLLDRGQVDSAALALAKCAPEQPVDQLWKSFLEGRLAAASGQGAEARRIFKELIESRRGLTEDLFSAIQFALAESWLADGDEEKAVEQLEDSMRDLKKGAGMRNAFALLDQAYARSSGDIPRQLEKWAERAPSPRQLLATFYLARAQQRHDELNAAQKSITQFLRQATPDDPLRASAQIMEVKILAQREKWEAALAQVEQTLAASPAPEVGRQLRLLGGWIRFQQRQFDAAADYFAAAVEMSAGGEREQVLFNMALARLNAHDQPGFLEAYRAFSTAFPESPLRSDLVFEQGMLAARAGEMGSAETLARFTEDFPNNENLPRAYLALAETAWLRGDPETMSDYRQAALTSDDEAVRERAEVLRIFQAAESGRKETEAEAIRAGRAFLEAHAASELVPEVRMKLGEIYFRSGDFGNARTQFEILARDHSKSLYAGPALFLAGQAAARSMNSQAALDLFEQVARSENPLRLHARAEQARLKSQLGVDEEAVALYDAVLNGEPDPELRHASIIGKAVSLVQLGEKDPARRPEALAALDLVIDDPNAAPAWRNEALYRKGKLLQSMGREDEALALFYDTIMRTVRSPADGEVFWFYRAGAEAARLLEQREEWRGAVAVYDKLAIISGPRSAEMRERKEKLQLEHFLWDEEPAAEAVSGSQKPAAVSQDE